jgi:hypothetical protein
VLNKKEAVNSVSNTKSIHNKEKTKKEAVNSISNTLSNDKQNN